MPPVLYEVHLRQQPEYQQNLHQAKVDEPIEPFTGGRVFYQASFWPARSIDNSKIEKGKLVLVIQRIGITLLVKTLQLTQ
ncbi:NfeD family protein [Phormidium sp. FACHB-322]|uniref:NfeD family protein n=1 Tax=unclassified Phormidium TaxID=2609805 RepID=UPI0016889CF7|nr:NfeD family protein [Phormidium sp. FACHB-77]MBD2028490.1 NfeD family protein [Phormidium sp. FACHB-322]MBD2049671.1 NfeD family protein [Leptolyngbya sp. FACHB-60]